MKLSQIKSNPKNPRILKDDKFKKLVQSLKDFPEMSEVREIVVNKDMIVLGGNMRLKAMLAAGWTEAPVKVVDWSQEKQDEFVIKDNSSFGEWDWDELANQYEAQQLDDWGIDLPKDFLPVEVEEDDSPEVSSEPAESVLGEIYQLGRHRVMCGSATMIDDVNKLMDGNKVDLIFTDPPYNVGFNGRSGKHDVIKNDDLSDADFEVFIDETCNTIRAINPTAYYIWCNWNFYSILQDKLDYKACIVWAKNVFGMGNGYRHQHEFCLFNGKIDEVVKNESDLWEVSKDSKYMHPTQKPVALSVRAFSNHIKLLNVLDLFGGSGSTLIGAEQTGRSAYVMELDPKYVDVIRKRYWKFTHNNNEEGWQDGTPAID